MPTNNNSSLSDNFCGFADIFVGFADILDGLVEILVELVETLVGLVDNLFDRYSVVIFSARLNIRLKIDTIKMRSTDADTTTFLFVMGLERIIL
jgi:hypothetical protein